MITSKLSNNRVVVLIGLLLTLNMALIYLFHPTFLVYIESKIYDTIIRSTARAPVSPALTVIDIDEASLDRLGQWPWPRYRLALMLEKIKRLGAVAVGLDMVFAEKDRTSPLVIEEDIKRDLYFDVDLEGLPEGLRDYDKILADTLFNGPFVLGQKLVFEKDTPQQKDCLLHPLKVAWLRAPGAPEKPAIFEANGVVGNLRVLAEAVDSSGFINALPDIDGVMRRVPLLIKYEDRYYPSLALATLMKAAGLKQVVLKVSPEGTGSLRLGNLTIPLGERGTVLINYRGRAKSYPYIPAWKILRDKLPKDALEGMIVFLGTSASGLRDIRTTPLEPIFPGVEVHATVVDNILNSDLVIRPEWAPGLELMILGLVGILSVLALSLTRAMWSLIPLSLVGLGLWMGSIWIMNKQGMFLSPLMALITLGANFAILTLVKYWREERRKQFFRTAFSHYVSPAVVKELLSTPKKLTLSGEEKEVTVLFSDIKGFTALSETLSPNQVTDLLHSYLTPMTRVVTDYQGTLDKYMGDALMAFWNAPLDIPDHQRRALEGALAMLRELGKINLDLQSRLGVTLEMGIGLHSGKVRVGNMGSSVMFDYTIIGDAVNLTDRLESLTRYYGLELLVSQKLKESCGEGFHWQEVDRVRVLGRTEPVTVYTALEKEDAVRRGEELERYGKGLEAYEAGEFEAGLEVFSDLAYRFPDTALYRIYRNRCAEFTLSPPDPGWDGVFTHREK